MSEYFTCERCGEVTTRVPQSDGTYRCTCGRTLTRHWRDGYDYVSDQETRRLDAEDDAALGVVEDDLYHYGEYRDPETGDVTRA